MSQDGAALSRLMQLQRLRVNYVFHTMFRVVIAGSVVYHLFVLRQERQEILKAKLQSELDLLKSQVAPHFFFNSLNSIYCLSLEKSDQAPDAIITLSDMMRYVLTDAKGAWVDLSQELDYLDRYVELLRLRLPLKTHLDYQVDVDGDYRIPPMLLIAIYENAFKYGTSTEREACISIHLKVESGTLCLQTHNDIIAVDEQKKTRNGLAVLRRRLELLYPHKHELSVQEIAGSYQLQLKIQLV